MEKIARIEASNELVVLIGDMNKHLGNGIYGIRGNIDKVSFGGKLIHKFLSNGKYKLVNNTPKCFGGPFTRVDPANPSNQSCLSLVMVSKDLYEYIETLTVDKDRLMTPHRSGGRNRTLIYTDHFSLLLIFKSMPMVKRRKVQTDKRVL